MPPDPEVETFDCSRIKDLGFTEVNKGGEEPDGDIVIIHGLQGHPWKTWACKTARKASEARRRSQRRFSLHHKSKSQNPVDKPASRSPQEAEEDDAPTFWPAELLAKDLPRHRISTYGYDSHISHFFGGAADQGNILTIGRDFLQELAAWRQSDPFRPLIFVCHSLGGLIVKEALVRARLSTNDADKDLLQIYESTLAIIFFGTPHRGSAYSNIGLTASRIASAAGFSVNETNIRDLKGNSPILEQLRESFADLLQDNQIHITTFQEGEGFTRSALMNGKIVEVDSSGVDHPYERKFTIHANHMGMCRFSDSGDDGYIKFRHEITRHIRRHSDFEMLKQQKCLESLYIPDMYIRAEQIDTAHEGTLHWLYGSTQQGPGLHQWLIRGREIFWVSGKPGSGKSTAMKYLFVNDNTSRVLKSADQADWNVTGLFFTDRGGEAQRSWECILHAMLYELVSYKPEILALIVSFGFQRDHLRRPLEKGLGNNSPDFSWDADKLENALLKCKEQTEIPFKICYFIDALDEHEGDHQRMGDFLKRLGKSQYDNSITTVRICVASRPSNQLLDIFGRCPGIEMQDWTRNDIEAYIESRTRVNRRMRLLLQGQYSRRASQLLRKIMRRANGVFLWVRLVVDELCKGLVAGDSIETLEIRIKELPDDLYLFFEHMLERVDTRYSLESLVILESVLRARVPLTVAQVAMGIFCMTASSAEKVIRSGRQVKFLLSAHDVDDMQRLIHTYTGGLLELKPPFSQQVDSDTESNEDEATIGETPNHLSGAFGIRRNRLLTNANMPLATWTVQPLHQTVKEFLRSPDQLKFLHANLDQEYRESQPRMNGHFFLLKACQYWLASQPVPNDRIQITPTLDIIVADVLYYSPLAERSLGYSPTELLRDIDRKITARSSERENWPSQIRSNSCFEIEEHYRFNFTAFAIATNMIDFVRQRLLEEDLSLNRKSGLPLLLFALLCPGHGADATERPTMVELLLEHGFSPKESVRDPHSGALIDALIVYLYIVAQGTHEWNDIAQPFTKTVQMLLSHQVNPNGRVCSVKEKRRVEVAGITADWPLWSYNRSVVPWNPILHFIASLPLDYEKLTILFQKFVAAGASLNAKASSGRTLLEVLLEHQVFLPLETWVWLLENGAKVTKYMVETQNLFLGRLSEHPLRSPECTKIHFYEWRAQESAWKFNPGWNKRLINPTHWVRSASDSILRAYVDTVELIKSETVT